MTMMDNENWRLDMRKTIEGFLVRLDEMMVQWKKNDVNGVKQEMKNEAVEEAKIEEDTENDIEEAEAGADIEEAEIEVGAQVSIDTEAKVAVLKIQVQVEELTEVEEKGKFQKRLDGDNFDFLVQQSDRDQTHNYEVNSKILDVVNYHEKLDGIYPMVFMTENKLVVMPDPYGFRLLMMEKRSDGAEQLHASYSFLDEIFGDPQVIPHVGDQYQAEIPPLVGECHSLQVVKKGIGSKVIMHMPNLFPMGLSIPLIWKKTEVESINGASESENREESHIMFSHGCANYKVESLDSVFGDGKDMRGYSKLQPTTKTKIGVDLLFLNEPKSKLNQVDRGPYPLPGFSSEVWKDIELDSFLLGLYIFGKNLTLMKNFVESKGMREILSFYCGKFYRSDGYCRWSECRKLRGRQRILGQKLFTGWRQQELLSQLFSHLSKEYQNMLFEVSKTFGEGKMSFEEYVFTIKNTVGIHILIEAIGIGKGKQDPTGNSIEPIKTNHVVSFRFVIPVGKACSALTSADIIKFLTGDFRLSKARSNDFFWEAVWPRLLAKCWHSEQPKDQVFSGSKNFLVFLVSGVKKFLRRRLVKGNNYFDFAQMVGSDISVFGQEPPAQMHSNGGIQQVSNASEHKEEHGNSDAFSAKQELEATKFEPGKIIREIHVDCDIVITMEFDWGFNPSVDLGFKGVDLKNGKNIIAWIEYREAAKLVQGWINYSSTQPPSLVLVAQIDISKQFKEYILLGFSVSNGQGFLMHIVDPWHFKTLSTYWPSVNPMDAIEEWYCIMCFLKDSSNNSPHFHGPHKRSLRKGNMVFISGCSAVLVVLVMANPVICFFVVRKKMGFDRRSKRAKTRVQINNALARWSFSELKSATMGFHTNNIIGEGVSAVVYKGCVPLGRAVVVKQFDQFNRNAFTRNPFATELVTMVESWSSFTGGAMRDQMRHGRVYLICSKDFLILILEDKDLVKGEALIRAKVMSCLLEV